MDFDLTPVCVGYVVEKVAVGQVYLWLLWFSVVSIFPSVLDTHSFIH
jgi:hypothetical protein